MNKKVFWAGAILLVVAAAVSLIFMDRGVGGDAGENGTPAPSPTPVSTPTVAPSTPTTTASVTPNASPSPTVAPIPVATITIRALENPYRFEPSTVTIKAGVTYTLELIGGEEQHDFVVNNADLPFYEIIPAHGLVTKVFTAPKTERRYLFEDPSHKKYGMEGVFIVTKE